MTSTFTPFLRRQMNRAAPVGSALLLALATLAPGAKASSLLVDGFDAPTAPVTSVFTSVDELQFNQFTPTVPGEVRGVYHHTYTNPLGSVAALAAGNGVISSSSGVGVQTEVLVLYGAFTRPTLDPDVGGPRLGLDLTPYDSFRFDFSGYSSVLNLNVTLYTANPLDPGAPLYYSNVGVNAAPAVPGGPMVVDLALDTQNTAFNFAQVDGIAVIINRANGATNVSWTLDSVSLVSSVPEPTPAALLAAGVGVLGWLRRRQAQAVRQP